MSASAQHDRILKVVGIAAVVMAMALVAGSYLADFKTTHTMLLFAAVPATLAAVSYAVLAPWWKSALGRILMSMMASVAMLLDLTLILNSLPLPLELMLLIARIVFGLAGAVSWVLLVYIVLAQVSPRAFRSEFPQRGDGATMHPHG